MFQRPRSYAKKDLKHFGTRKKSNQHQLSGCIDGRSLLAVFQLPGLLVPICIGHAELGALRPVLKVLRVMTDNE